MTRRRWIDVALVAVLFLLIAGSFVIGRSVGDGEFAGTDATATERVEGDGHEPWFTPLFEPESAELESGLFALQAGLGGIALGYCIGRLHARRHREAEGSPAATPVPSGGPAETGGR